jgi:hypothetical protein
MGPGTHRPSRPTTSARRNAPPAPPPRCAGPATTTTAVGRCRRGQVHALFTNEELRESFDTVEALRAADRLQDYIAWIRTTDKLHVETRTSDHVRER